MKKKGFALILAAALLVVGVVGGTMAWLTDKTDPVVNTFSTSDIQVRLEETKGDPASSGSIREFKMVPGYTIEKDPKAWVVKGSEDCYLFVKLDWANNTYTSGETTKNYLTWAIADGWTLVPGENNVYYRIVTSGQMSDDNGTTNAFPVLAGNKVTVSGEITKEMMNDIDAGKVNNPTLTITAYASQLHKNASETFTPAQAWANIPR